jgi:uncharacterized protein (DUF1684 family)
MTIDTATFSEEWQAWHAGHEEARAAPHGFLAVTSLRWLGGVPERFPDAPGAWSAGPDGVVVELAEDESLLVGDQPVTGRHLFEAELVGRGVLAAFGDAVVEVARRGGADILRPRHPDSPRRPSYAGTPAYPAQRRWALAARFEPYDEPESTVVGSVVDGLEHVYAALGELAFEVDGRPLRLVAFPGAEPETLLVLFRDLTSGDTTVPAVRGLTVPLPAGGLTVVLDFNRAVNLPCAYTPYATCPLPPRQNHLPIAVEAGEKRPS